MQNVGEESRVKLEVVQDLRTDGLQHRVVIAATHFGQKFEDDRIEDELSGECPWWSKGTVGCLRSAGSRHRRSLVGSGGKLNRAAKELCFLALLGDKQFQYGAGCSIFAGGCLFQEAGVAQHRPLQECE